jgi:deoxyribodipyrimidine photo-lyase
MQKSQREDPRIQQLNRKPCVEGDYVLYWMQQSQRAEENLALEHAIRTANSLRLPTVVAFGLTDDYPEANLRHYVFMLEGLREVRRQLLKRNIPFVVQHGEPPEVALRLARRASVIVCDRGYLRHQKMWRSQVSREAPCLVQQVECDAVVPVAVASEKKEHSARAFRSRVLRLQHLFLDPLRPIGPVIPCRNPGIESVNLEDEDSVFEILRIDTGIKPVPLFAGGTRAAKTRLARFIGSGLAGYAENRNQPGMENLSHMSPYLHFGQIAPAYIARKIRFSHGGTAKDRESFLDELIVRRELSINFVHHAEDYDCFSSLPSWAQASLQQHIGDRRFKIYSREELEGAETHDPYWNAAMNEMKWTGYMHNHMRMYWGKQILAWSRTPETAFQTALELNNKYFLDGRDPNSYANVGWIFGLHDRPWPEREVYGIVRSMTIDGLKRKADPEAYVRRVMLLGSRATIPNE